MLRLRLGNRVILTRVGHPHVMIQLLAAPGTAATAARTTPSARRSVSLPTCISVTCAAREVLVWGRGVAAPVLFCACDVLRVGFVPLHVQLTKIRVEGGHALATSAGRLSQERVDEVDTFLRHAL